MFRGFLPNIKDVTYIMSGLTFKVKLIRYKDQIFTLYLIPYRQVKVEVVFIIWWAFINRLLTFCLVFRL